MALMHARRSLQLFHNTSPPVSPDARNILLMANSLSSQSAHGRASRHLLVERLGRRPERTSRCRQGSHLFGIARQWGRRRRLLVGDGGDDAKVDDQEAHPQQVEPPHAILELGAMGSPEQSGTRLEGSSIFGYQQAVELFSQVVSVLLDLAQQLAKTDLVLKALDLGDVPVVALVLFDGKVDGIYEGSNLLGRHHVCGPMGVGDLGDDDQRQAKGGQDQYKRPLDQARVGHDAVDEAV